MSSLLSPDQYCIASGDEEDDDDDYLVF